MRVTMINFTICGGWGWRVDVDGNVDLL